MKLPWSHQVLLRLSVLRSAFGDLELREPGTLGRRVFVLADSGIPQVCIGFYMGFRWVLDGFKRVYMGLYWC